jgi:hypothetical protein
MLKSCDGIDIQNIVAAGHKGKVIGEELHRKRLNRMKAYKKSWEDAAA